LSVPHELNQVVAWNSGEYKQVVCHAENNYIESYWAVTILGMKLGCMAWGLLYRSISNNPNRRAKWILKESQFGQ